MTNRRRWRAGPAVVLWVLVVIGPLLLLACPARADVLPPTVPPSAVAPVTTVSAAPVPTLSAAPVDTGTRSSHETRTVILFFALFAGLVMVGVVCRSAGLSGRGRSGYYGDSGGGWLGTSGGGGRDRHAGGGHRG